MNQSEVNHLQKSAERCFLSHGWALPPEFEWEVTDFGLGNWKQFGLVLITLANEPEYCEKLMYAQKGMTTPAHCHKKKKEDIVVRWGIMRIVLWANKQLIGNEALEIKLNRVGRNIVAGESILLKAGERITIPRGIYHEFEAISSEVILGEVSTANDDIADNFFANPKVLRFSKIEDNA